jgi:hypothetical protein
MKALDESNRIRRRKGKNPMSSAGPVRMLQNAMDHSKTLPASFEHQNLSLATNKVQCGVFISGVNIAMHHDSSITDHVAFCMRQWENSPDLLDNILSKFDCTVRSNLCSATFVSLECDIPSCTAVFNRPTSWNLFFFPILALPCRPSQLDRLRWRDLVHSHDGKDRI